MTDLNKYKKKEKKGVVELNILYEKARLRNKE
jgi:hypothetical protein